MLHRLIRLAEIYNVAVVLTNQVQSQPDSFFGGIGGGVIQRVQLEVISWDTLLHTGFF